MPSKRELFHIAGDTPEAVRERDPDAPGAIKSSMTYDLASKAAGHPRIRYVARDGHEFLITCDVYQFEGEPLKLVILCPMCSTEEEAHSLNIDSDKKRVEWEPGEMPAAGGRLNVERFECTWEKNTHQDVARGHEGVIIGGNRCRWRVVIENNVARDA